MRKLTKVCQKLIMASWIFTLTLPAYANQKEKALQPNTQTDKQPVRTSAVKGKITDANGESIIGATIMVKGTSTGTVSDMDGQFTLPSIREKSVLVISYVGYKTREVTANRSELDIVLEEDSETLDEVVVTGYGTLKKTQLVGAVENLSGKALEGRTNSSITRSLQGQIPGLNIIQVDGKPTHQGEVYVRGGKTSYNTRVSMNNADGVYKTIGQGGSALVLIDGVEGDLTSVNPEDVETVSVLKDAASAAVYGARGAFGVILITTKKPVQERVRINYNGSFSVNRRTVLWEDNLVTDGLVWLDNFVNFFQNDTRTPTSSKIGRASCRERV